MTALTQAATFRAHPSTSPFPMSARLMPSTHWSGDRSAAASRTDQPLSCQLTVKGPGAAVPLTRVT